MLELVNVDCRVDGVQALAGVSLAFKRGRSYGIIGPSGAGKTSVLDAVCGLAPLHAGQVLLDGQRIDRLPAHRIARKGIVRSFQRARLLPALTLVEFLVVGQHGRGSSRLLGELCFFRSARDERSLHLGRAYSMLERVGLQHLAEYPVGSLTLGEQRRLEVARALAQAPDYLLLDEPAAGLDERETNKLDNLLREVADSGVTIVLAEHDVVLAGQFCDWLAALNAGEIVGEGKPGEVSANPAVVAAYLGA